MSEKKTKPKKPHHQPSKKVNPSPISAVEALYVMRTIFPACD